MHFFRSQPKFSANWDRSQTRPLKPNMDAAVLPRPAKKPRTKAKPKSQPVAAGQPEPLFEEVVFTTPPVTPPAKPPSPAKLPAAFERDDEFWAFYDKK